MIDTIVLNSPDLEEDIALKIEEISVQRMGVDFQINELLYRFTTKELKGTYDSSIRINIKREKLISEFDLRTRKNIATKRQCNPYMQVECSLHKIKIGHNIFGGSDDIKGQVLYLISLLENELQVDLPNYNDWFISRIDYAKVYNLGNSLSDFFKGFSNVYYPRRSAIKYSDSGLYFPGTYTTLKLYDKGLEFKKHDKKKLRKILTPYQIMWLELLSHGILRIEVEVKTRKLKDLYNEKLPKVNEIKIEDLINQYNVEIGRIFKIGEDKMKIYNTTKDVENVLYSHYGSEGNILFGTWFRLTITGYDTVKKSMAKTTFYRHINKLKKAGISWNYTDVTLEKNKVIEFIFNPLNSDLEVNDDYIFRKVS